MGRQDQKKKKKPKTERDSFGLPSDYLRESGCDQLREIEEQSAEVLWSAG